MQQIHGPLMVGSSGEDVKIVQSILNRALPAKQIATDGIFGVRTEAVVRAFQESRNLLCDGIVGRRTAEALGLSYVARAPVQSISEIRRRQLRAASDPGDLQREEREPVTAGVDEQGGAAGALAAAIISSYTLIYRKLKRMLKNTVAVSGDGQKRMGALLAQCYSGSVATVGAVARSSNPDAFAPMIISSTGWWSAALTGCAAVLSASAAPADQQLGIKFRSMSRTLGLNGLLAAGKVNMLLHGSGERLDVAVPTIMNKLLEAVRR